MRRRPRSISLALLVVPTLVLSGPSMRMLQQAGSAVGFLRWSRAYNAAVEDRAPIRRQVAHGHSRSSRGVARAAAQSAATLTRPSLEDSCMQLKIENVFEEALRSALPPSLNSTVQIIPADPKFGDYQCNNAMAAFKKLKQEAADLELPFRSPRDVGMAIKDGLPALADDFIDEAVVAPQGFVTVKLRIEWLERRLRDMYQSGMRFTTSKPQNIIIDYSSPNVAKEMHVGHLRSTILGDTIANLLEGLGHKVKRLNHVGDWGTQFGMLLEFMRRESSGGGSDLLTSSADLVVRDLQKLYRDAKEVFDKDPEFRKASQLNVVALQSGEPWAKDAWERICEASRIEFEEIYTRLGITGLEERGESFYNEMLPGIVEQLSSCGLAEESDGAKVVFTSAGDAPLIVQKADGGFGYDSTDLAAVQHRLKEEGAERIIYVVDNGQELHFRMVFQAAGSAGWLDAQQLDFMGFGLVQGADGKKFKTRSGDVVRLRDLLDEAASRAAEELRKRVESIDSEGGDGSPTIDEAKLQRDSEAIGVAAVKYFDLRQNRNSDYRFSFDAILDPKGNTAVYVLYAYARICAILKRSSLEVNVDSLSLVDATERALALRIARLPDVLREVEVQLLPSRLIDYIYNLASDFTSFYMACPVVGSDHEASRLALCEITRSTMDACLKILRITPLQRL